MKLISLLIASLCITMMLHAQVSKTLSVTAGGLSTSLTVEEKNTVTNLTLTGTIDARDFKTMRDNMPLLAEINLSGAVIVAYSGTEGTEGAPNDYLEKEIPKYAFLNPVGSVSKTSLTQIKFQPDLLSISYAAFLGCTGLTSIEIPATVNEFKNGAFENCTNLKSIKCAAKVPPTINGNVFSGVSKTGCTVFVPLGSVASYKAAGQWQDFQNIIEMIAYWTFDDQTGTMLRDRSGNGLYGKLGGSTWLIENGLTCLSFNGISDCVLVPNNPAFNVGNENFAIEIHFKTSVIPSGSFSSLISKHNESINYDKDIEIYIQGGTGVPVFRLSDGAGIFETATGTTNVCDGQFHKVLGTREGNQLKIYVDGKLENSVNTTINPDNNNWYMIGKTSYGNYPGSGFFAGIIDEISIWKNPVIKPILRTLIITEARMDNMNEAYVEITNMGENPVQLSEYEFGTIRPWATPWNPEPNRSFMLPEKILQPGESYTIAVFNDFGPEQWLNDPDNYPERGTKKEWEGIADLKFHVPEPNGDETDEIIGGYHWTFDVWNGRECWYLRQHSETESVVIDQVGGVFDSPEGRNYDRSYDVAGVPGATGNSILVRKFSIKNGNIDFANARGVGLDDSEWMPISRLFGAPEPWRDVFWTAGNHGDYNLDENTLVSKTLTVDWQNKIISAPWGIRNNDDFMHEFVKKPGLAWHYHLSAAGDDLDYISARTGDRITIYACGIDLDMETFEIIVQEPTANDNIVIPKHRKGPLSNFFFGFGFTPQAGQVDWPRVTRQSPVMDTITGSHFGIPYSTRTDTLLKYLEKAPKANWEIVFKGGVQRADFTDGDILKVIAENGAVKEYYVQVQAYRPAHNAELASIIWPDIPEVLRNRNGWNGNTIPNFMSQLYEYTLNIPHYVTGVPVFVPIPTDRKAIITTRIIDPLEGNIANKIIEYTVTAEDGYTKRIYNIYLNKLKDPVSIQPFMAEPFLSELIFWDQWNNSFGEICNPGTEPLDLSDYMIAMQWNTNPASVIQSRMGANEWLDRYDKYVPGYKWVNESQWQVTPGILIPDPNVNPIVQPGDVFAFGGIWSDGQTAPSWMPNYVWPVPAQLDIQFNMFPNNSNKRNFPNGYINPWGEPISVDGSPIRKWSNSNWYMFKILNDSVKLGLKPANDPNDFELIERFGMGDGTAWVIGGNNRAMIDNWMITNFMRKSDIHKGNPVANGSFGTNLDNTEWTWTNPDYWNAQFVGWPMSILNIGNDLGKHSLNEITDYQSVVYSRIYKVSPGYSANETINAVLTGASVGQFNDNIIKSNENQTLTVTSGIDGSVLNITDILSNGDVLTVLSADQTNTTRYFIGTSDIGLSNEVVLVPEENSIVVVQDNTFTGFIYGTTLQELMANIVIPEGAKVTIVDANNNLIPFTIPNYQGEYVNVSVNAGISVIVTAEDGVTEMVYNLEPEFAAGEIFVASDFFEINQADSIIGTVEPGTTVEQLMANMFTLPGATIKIVDKYGFERTTGPIYPDDKLVVTYDENAVAGLKSLAEPLVKEYHIFMCDKPAVVKVKDIVIELDELETVIITPADIDNGSFGKCGSFTLSISKTEFRCSDQGQNKVILSLVNEWGVVTSEIANVTVICNAHQEITLNPGWNIMSFRVVPNNKDLKNIFQSMIEEGKLKKVMDEEGKSIEDWGVFGSWKNGIGELLNTEGYKVNVKSQAILTLEGTPIKFPFEIQLKTGWNIISWPLQNEQDGMNVFKLLIDSGKLKKVMDEAGNTIEDWGVFGSWKNNIGNLKPGEGYNVNVTTDCILTVNESGTKSEIVIPATFLSTHFIPAFKGNGTDHMNINLINLAESGIIIDDEIGIFDGNICVGSAKIINHLPIAIGTLIVNRNSISIPVSAIDGIEDKNGYSDGNPIILKLFRNGNEYSLKIHPINQSKIVFEKGNSLFAQVDLVTGIEGRIPDTNLTEINCYPNPFSDEVNIEIKLAKDSEVQVEVLNQLGQRVKTLATEIKLNNGTHLLKWNGKNTANQQVSSGIYMIRIMIGSEISFKKIIYSKVE